MSSLLCDRSVIFAGTDAGQVESVICTTMSPQKRRFIHDRHKSHPIREVGDLFVFGLEHVNQSTNCSNRFKFVAMHASCDQ